MKIKQIINMSFVLITLMSLGLTGCGGSSSEGSSNPGVVSTAVDIIVERGKVYEATVTDSSTPRQVAIQKSGKNIYTFAKAPVYPVLVTGGWIDVNDDGILSRSDTKLDIEMKSYTTTVTPVTTFVADASETVRKEKLEALVARLNASGVGSAADITVEDLLKVPSEAPRDVFVTANAIYKDMKEHGDALPDEDAVLSQFATVDASLPANGTAKDLEVQVVGDLVANGNSEHVSAQDIFELEQEEVGAVVPELAKAILKNNISLENNGNLGLFLNENLFYSNHTILFENQWSAKWRVEGKNLIISEDANRPASENLVEIFTFESETPVDGSSVHYKKTDIYGTYEADYNITVSAEDNTVIDTPTEDVLPDLSTYNTIIIYKNITQSKADSLLNSYVTKNEYGSKNVNSNCSDLGILFDHTDGNHSIYAVTSPIYRVCDEYDFTNDANSGTINVTAYYKDPNLL